MPIYCDSEMSLRDAFMLDCSMDRLHVDQLIAEGQPAQITYSVPFPFLVSPWMHAVCTDTEHDHRAFAPAYGDMRSKPQGDNRAMCASSTAHRPRWVCW